MDFFLVVRHLEVADAFADTEEEVEQLYLTVALAQLYITWHNTRHDEEA